MTELHLTEEQLAAISDDSVPEGQRAFLTEHLRQCPHCHEAYLDAVRYRGIFISDSTVFRAPDDALLAARRIAPTSALRGRPARETRSASWALPRLALGLASVAVVVGAIALWQGLSLEPRPDVRIEALRSAARLASSEGSILLPGVESTASVTTPLHRSGFVEPDEAITTAIRELSRSYREKPNAEVAHWLVSGYLATGDVESADIFVNDARLRFPNDSRFLVLDGIIAYRSNEMERAERLLQAALGNEPTNGAALLNLALVQYETGQVDSARRTLELVRTQFPDSPLEVRATTLISDLLNG